MKIRNKQTGQIFEVLPGTLYAKNLFEEVKDDDIKVGEPKVEFEIEEEKEEKPKKVTKKVTKKKKGAKKNGNSGNSTK